MILQVKLLLLLVNLFFGSIVIGFIFQRMRLYNSLYLRIILNYTIILNTILFIVFLLKYFEINILSTDLYSYTSSYLPFLFSLVYLSIITLVFTMHKISLAFKNVKMQSKHILFYYLIILVFGSMVFTTSKYAMNNKTYTWILNVYDNFGLIFILWEILILYRLYNFARNENHTNILIKSFAILYFLRYPLLIVAFLIPDPMRLFSVIFILNLIPVIWIKFFVDKIEKACISDEVLDIVNNKFVSKYNITVREMEILKLILEGKNNKQIKQELYISYHTVKNHVYNIFQKLNITNRYQLFTLINNLKQHE